MMEKPMRPLLSWAVNSARDIGSNSYKQYPGILVGYRKGYMITLPGLVDGGGAKASWSGTPEFLTQLCSLFNLDKYYCFCILACLSIK